MVNTLRIKRIYEAPAADDGIRILVDRLWPRGMSKEKAHLHEWAKDIAPSPDLRTWFGHKPEWYEEFSRLYMAELDMSPAAADFADRCRENLEHGNVTLVYAAKDTAHSHALVLQHWLEPLLAK